jgi:diaminohydroxyphosphoribosylaminopyrimidine deaminase/5-amino-6-(5-phosphoribosylamino)uracil reductase
MINDKSPLPGLKRQASSLKPCYPVVVNSLAHMQRAIRLARRGMGYVEPNPMVGCVIVKDEQVVGEGWHKRFGGPHAEVEALRAAGEASRGATVFVTLEPCPHFGKTPPCSRALIDAGVARVVIGTLDPHPDRGSVGVEQLEAAGITVERSPLEAQCIELIAPFLKRVNAGLPYVIGKWAATVDGAIATASGDSRWISSEASRINCGRASTPSSSASPPRWPTIRCSPHAASSPAASPAAS